MKSNQEITKQFRLHKQTTERGLSKQYENTRDCNSFYAGDLMAYRDSIQFQDQWGQKKKALVQFNKVKPYVNAVKGFMAQNRRRAKYVARLQNDKVIQLYSQYCNSLAEYVREETNADQVETQQNGDMLTCGYGVVETSMTYGVGHATTDPNGQIIMGRLSPLQFGWDPFATAPNIEDRRWDFYQQDYALKDAVELFDEEEQKFEEASDHDLGEDSGYTFYARGGRYNKIKETNLDWSDEKAEMVKVYFYQWYEFETFYRAENPIYSLKNPQAVMMVAAQLQMLQQELTDEQTDLFSFDAKAEILTFDAETKAKLEKILAEFIEIHSFKRKVFYSAVISKDFVFSKYRNICQQGFTRKVKTGDYDAKNKIWTGMVNSMKDPVMYYNKALTELMFTIGANSKGGVMYERSAIQDIQKFEGAYAKTDASVMVEDGALTEGKVQPKRVPFAPTGYEQIIQLSDSSIADVSGIDKTFLGSSENKNETGLLQARRIKQVVSALACYFDSDTLYQKEHARLLLDFLRVYAQNNAGGLFRIIGRDGRAQFLKISSDHLTPQYDVTIEEAPQSAEEKREFAGIITQMVTALLPIDAASAKQLMAIGLKYLPLDQEDQQSIIQILTPQSPQIDPAMVQKMQQQLQLLMSQANQAEVKDKLSRFALNMAKADETRSKIPESAAKVREMNASAVQKHASAFHDIHESFLDEKIANKPEPRV